ncbi:hypothetical protein NKR23_g9330 [Pleurostoma richardsiae]|uniref:Bola-like protein n=1 Tax=Pleurostoma richardsiae TaxID=41990 RepID=A0AA38RN34_9PEZI|nr:hypothetical protein NKR23_g9330 [Pleurostoma richardsiae]
MLRRACPQPRAVSLLDATAAAASCRRLINPPPQHRALCSASRASTVSSSKPILSAIRTSGHSRRSSRSVASPFRRAYSAASSEASSAPSSELPPSALPEKPDYLDDAESEIWDRLTREFSPAHLLVQDISGGCGSMYGIEISSDRFRGVNMLKQQRMVNAVLGDLMKGWHGVQLKTRVP